MNFVFGRLQSAGVHRQTRASRLGEADGRVMVSTPQEMRNREGMGGRRGRRRACVVESDDQRSKI